MFFGFRQVLLGTVSVIYLRTRWYLGTSKVIILRLWFDLDFRTLANVILWYEIIARIYYRVLAWETALLTQREWVRIPAWFCDFSGYGCAFSISRSIIEEWLRTFFFKQWLRTTYFKLFFFVLDNFTTHFHVGTLSALWVGRYLLCGSRTIVLHCWRHLVTYSV